MAVSLGYGIVFATCITLVLVPCLYIVIEDIVTLPHTIRQFLSGRSPSDDQPTPLDGVAK
jgi:hypothetical protein